MTDELSTPPTMFRFPDEATGMAALDAAGLLTKDGAFITASHHHALDVIGIIIRDENILPGWHLNYVGELPDGWLDYAVAPKNPVRVFAG